MQVLIKFDTETESIEEIQKVINSLQDLVDKKKTNPNGIRHTNIQQQTSNNQVQNNGTQNNGKTTGGGRVVPYEDMSGVLSKIWSNQKC